MTYLIDRKNGNRVYRQENSGVCMLDAFSNQWVHSELADSCTQISEAEARMYEKALQIAHKAHKGQKDKAGADYINHPVTVSSFAEGNMVSVIAALLHDVIEDTPVTLDDLRAEGFDEKVIGCVDALTHRKEEARSAYIERIAANRDAIYVKLADLRHNSDLGRLEHITQKDLYRLEKYKREAEYLRGILEKENA